MVIGEIQHISPMELLKMAANPPFPWEDDIYLKPIVEDDPLLQFGMYHVCLYCLYMCLPLFVCLWVCLCSSVCVCTHVCMRTCVLVHLHVLVC